MFQVNIQGLFIDRKTGEFLALLKEEEGDRTLPIWIQFNEMLAMAKELSENALRSPRPLTHDLARDMISGLDARVIRVQITGLDNYVYTARLALETANTQLELDARPSDAIILALKFHAPLYVSDDVAQKHKELIVQAGQTPETLVGRLQEFRPEDFMNFR